MPLKVATVLYTPYNTNQPACVARLPYYGTVVHLLLTQDHEISHWCIVYNDEMQQTSVHVIRMLHHLYRFL